MQEMCEHIVKADILQFKDDGTSPKAEEYLITAGLENCTWYLNGTKKLAIK